MRVAIGLTGALESETLVAIAPRIEAAGFAALWLNDVPGGDSLGGLAAAASVTSTLGLGAGVIPLDRRSAPQIAAATLALDLPQERLTIGVGSGGPKNALARVRQGVDLLREALTAPVLAGALGPRMRRLAAEHADGVLLNWLTPGSARAAVDELHAVGRGRAVLYARTAVDESALAALGTEAARYASYPAYAANFEREGVRAIDATIRPGRLRAAVEAYGAVDELVLRAVVADDTQLPDFIDRAAAELGL